MFTNILSQASGKRREAKVKQKRKRPLPGSRTGQKSYSSGGGEPTSSFHPTTALFASFSLHYEVLCVSEALSDWRGSTSRSTTPRCHGVTVYVPWTPLFPREKNLYRRGRCCSLSTDPNRGRLNFDTSFTRGPPRVCSRRRVKRRGYRSPLLSHEFTLHSTRLLLRR